VRELSAAESTELARIARLIVGDQVYTIVVANSLSEEAKNIAWSMLGVERGDKTTQALAKGFLDGARRY
jgi:hypothetical protein